MKQPTKRQFVQVFDEDDTLPNCPGCWNGRLRKIRANLWICDAGFTQCGRRYKEDKQ